MVALKIPMYLLGPILNIIFDSLSMSQKNPRSDRGTDDGGVVRPRSFGFFANFSKEKVYQA